MNIREAYNSRAEQYDTNTNKTRDLEAIALRSILQNVNFKTVLEIGCGTGKNSEWIVTKSNTLVAVDFSDEMLQQAKNKINSPSANFINADITNDWNFTEQTFDLVTFSLVLEHIQDLNFVFSQAKQKVSINGFVYIGELHPFKQYSGSVARFEKEGETVAVECFVHHVSEFISAAENNGFKLHTLNEWFDDEERTSIPRILTIVFQSI